MNTTYNVLIVNGLHDHYLHLTYSVGRSAHSVAMLDKRLLSDAQIEQATPTKPLIMEAMDFYTLRDGAIDAVQSKLEVIKRYG